MQFHIIALLSLTGALANQEAEMGNGQGMWMKQITEKFSKSECNTVCASAIPNPQSDCPCDLIAKFMKNPIAESSPAQDSVANVLSSVLGNNNAPTPTMPAQGVVSSSGSMVATPLLDIKPTGVTAAPGEDHSHMGMGDKQAHHKWFTISDANAYSSKLSSNPSSLANKNYMASKSASGAAPSMVVPSSIAFPSKPSSMSKHHSASKSSDSLRNIASLSVISIVSVIAILI